MLLAIIVRNFSYGEEKISFFGKEWIQFFRLGTAWGVHGSRGMADAGGGGGRAEHRAQGPARRADTAADGF